MITILACRNPDSLEDAIEILFKSSYAYYDNKTVNTSNSNNTNNRTKTDNNINGHNNFNNRQVYHNSHANTRTNNYQFLHQHLSPYYQQNPNNNSQNNQRNFNNPNVQQRQSNVHQNAQQNQANNYLCVPEPMDVNLVRNSDVFYTLQDEPFEQNFDNDITNQQEPENSEPFLFKNDNDDETPQNFPLVASQESYRI